MSLKAKNINLLLEEKPGWWSLEVSSLHLLGSMKYFTKGLTDWPTLKFKLKLTLKLRAVATRVAKEAMHLLSLVMLITSTCILTICFFSLNINFPVVHKVSNKFLSARSDLDNLLLRLPLFVSHRSTFSEVHSLKVGCSVVAEGDTNFKLNYIKMAACLFN